MHREPAGELPSTTPRTRKTGTIPRARYKAPERPPCPNGTLRHSLSYRDAFPNCNSSATDGIMRPKSGQKQRKSKNGEKDPGQKMADACGLTIHPSELFRGREGCAEVFAVQTGNVGDRNPGGAGG